MARFLSTGLALVFSLVLVPAAALAADIALVIGNSNYRNAPTADSAAIDARAVAGVLEGGGYDVTLGIDLNRREMARNLSRFAGKITDADRVVVYYSGHALRADGVTYLAPVDQENESIVEVVLDGVPLDLVLQLVGTRPGQAVVFIDAAQLEGFTPKRFVEPGLAGINPGQGVLVVSAAAPGQAIRRGGAYESRFARQVMREFLEPGARLGEAMRRLRGPTWVTGEADPHLSLVPPGRGPVAGGGRQPSGVSPDQAEAQMNMSREQRYAVQENLTLLGHDPRGVDGVFGPGTRTAIRLWQRANNLTETGYLDREQFALLISQADAASRPQGSAEERYWESAVASGSGDAYREYLLRFADGAHASEAREALKRMARLRTDAQAVQEMQVWRAASLADKPWDYRNYLRSYPVGIWQPEAEERLAALIATPALAPAPPPRDPRADEAALGLARTDRLSVEQRLNYLHFPPGNIDGFFDASTRRAINDYQRSRGFEPSGYLDQPTIVRLLDETGGSRPGIVIDGAAVLRGLLGGN